MFILSHFRISFLANIQTDKAIIKVEGKADPIPKGKIAKKKRIAPKAAGKKSFFKNSKPKPIRNWPITMMPKKKIRFLENKP